MCEWLMSLGEAEVVLIYISGGDAAGFWVLSGFKAHRCLVDVL